MWIMCLEASLDKRNGNGYQCSKAISYKQTSSLHFIGSSHGVPMILRSEQYRTAVQQIRHHYYYYVELKGHGRQNIYDHFGGKRKHTVCNVHGQSSETFWHTYTFVTHKIYNMYWRQACAADSSNNNINNIKILQLITLTIRIMRLFCARVSFTICNQFGSVAMFRWTLFLVSHEATKISIFLNILKQFI